MKWSPQYHSACQIQKLILGKMGLRIQHRNEVIKPDPEHPVEIKSSELCALTKAWDTLEERKRILRMKGLPKAVNAEAKRKSTHTFVAPKE